MTTDDPTFDRFALRQARVQAWGLRKRPPKWRGGAVCCKGRAPTVPDTWEWRKAKPRWRFQVAKLSQEWFVNKVGTYGMARAQLYWGRMEALLLRLLYSLFPSIDWQFAFVDDFLWLLTVRESGVLGTAILRTLLALGTPLSWKKTRRSQINMWLGFAIDPAGPTVQMACNCLRTSSGARSSRTRRSKKGWEDSSGPRHAARSPSPCSSHVGLGRWHARRRTSLVL